MTASDFPPFVPDRFEPLSKRHAKATRLEQVCELTWKVIEKRIPMLNVPKRITVPKRDKKSDEVRVTCVFNDGGMSRTITGKGTSLQAALMDADKSFQAKRRSPQS